MSEPLCLTEEVFVQQSAEAWDATNRAFVAQPSATELNHLPESDTSITPRQAPKLDNPHEVAGSRFASGKYSHASRDALGSS